MLRLFLGIATATLFFAPIASADDDERRFRDRMLDEVRVAATGNMASGSHRVGFGSRERYRLASADLQVSLTRFSSRRVGFDFQLTFAPPFDRDLFFVRAEAGGDLALATWSGPVPGSWIVCVGIGGDFGRYWFAKRGYPYASSRLRLWPTRRIAVQVRYEAIPVSLGADLPTWEQRAEIATSVSLFQFGLRGGWVVATGGEPSRTYTQQELGAFVALSVM